MHEMFEILLPQLWPGLVNCLLFLTKSIWVNNVAVFAMNPPVLELVLFATVCCPLTLRTHKQRLFATVLTDVTLLHELYNNYYNLLTLLVISIKAYKWVFQFPNRSHLISLTSFTPQIYLNHLQYSDFPISQPHLWLILIFIGFIT